MAEPPSSCRPLQPFCLRAALGGEHVTHRRGPEPAVEQPLSTGNVLSRQVHVTPDDGRRLLPLESEGRLRLDRAVRVDGFPGVGSVPSTSSQDGPAVTLNPVAIANCIAAMGGRAEVGCSAPSHFPLVRRYLLKAYPLRQNLPDHRYRPTPFMSPITNLAVIGERCRLPANEFRIADEQVSRNASLFVLNDFQATF